ncbi:hypothetical protein [Chitinophaga agri]|uniref:Uncharacterized protein n=1 Tax=Chitinophaga agri TaxID=2703787 RepID=A0A6B9ZDY4_9BACT|nr:hypothetical protein [Chitinophaga agri]QHS59949.1 hypothetical protein GWR21_10200 [Chitinophaga agri]
MTKVAGKSDVDGGSIRHFEGGFATTPGTYTTGAYTIVARTARRENCWQRLTHIFRKKETLTPDLNKTL